MTDNAVTGGRRTDRLAILTYALAVLWLFGIGSLIALYVGRRSILRMRVHRELRGRTLAWAGVAVAILGVLVAGLWFSLWLGLSLSA